MSCFIIIIFLKTEKPVWVFLFTNDTYMHLNMLLLVQLSKPMSWFACTYLSFARSIYTYQIWSLKALSTSIKKEKQQKKSPNPTKSLKYLLHLNQSQKNRSLIFSTLDLESMVGFGHIVLVHCQVGQSMKSRGQR